MFLTVRAIAPAAFLFSLLVAGSALGALGDPQYISFEPLRNALPLVQDRTALPIWTDADAGVRPSYLGPPQSPRVSR